jgi:hypothetical protein
VTVTVSSGAAPDALGATTNAINASPSTSCSRRNGRQRSNLGIATPSVTLA